MSIPISVTILIKNSEKYLFDVLSALKEFDEILLLDNGSTDSSIAIAKQFANVVIKQHEFIGFGPLKNMSATFCRNEWILNIDSDEIISDQLIQSLKAINLSDIHVVYSLNRLNHYAGKAIKGCGLYPDYVNRLYNKTVTSFNDNLVHERIICDNIQVKKLTGDLLHYSYSNASDLISKIQHYSTLYADSNQYKKLSSVSKAIFHGLSAFLKNYILKRGFLHGATGYVLSVSSGQGSYYKYIKLYEANQLLKITLVITTYNRPDALEAVLNSVLYQTKTPVQVIVADDGSTEETKLVVEKYQKLYKIPLIHSWQENLGFRAARSRNLAISKAIGDYIITIDGDMVLHPKFIADHARYAKLGQFIQGSRIFLPDNTTEAILSCPDIYPQLKCYSKGLDNRIEKRFLSIHLPLLTKIFIKPSSGEVLKGIRSCNMSFFKQDFLDINGFNNKFIGWGREDSEFVARLYNNGIYRINLKFAAIAYHLWHDEEEKTSLEINDRLLEEALNHKIIKCTDGIEQLV